MIIPILKSNINFTPYYFYNYFINDVADFYRQFKNEIIEFKLINENDIEASSSKYYIDPISIPLILSLFEQLKKFHKQPIKLHLSNNFGVIDILAFLIRSDFFHIVGNNYINPNFPRGKNILDYDPAFLGYFKKVTQRYDHKVRAYSINEDNLKDELGGRNSEESKRDYLIEHFTYKVSNHFESLLFENDNTARYQPLFIEILAELITNGVLHSKSDVFTLMFVDKFTTKFSISDNGIGLYQSLLNKDDTFFYKKFSLTKTLKTEKLQMLNTLNTINENLYSIIEILFYSMLKDRKGLFDLMCNVVLNCQGYFRLHTDYCQIIISSRMFDSLSNLFLLRKHILDTHNNHLLGISDKKSHHEKIVTLTEEAKNKFKSFYVDLIKNYSEETKFSLIRIFGVKFRGVHIEVEIPNSY